MKKNGFKKIFITFLVVPLFTLAILPSFANAQEEKKINFEKRNYSQDQISDEKLMEMAKKGQTINTHDTKTNFQDGDISVTGVKKILSEDFENGELVKQEVISLQEIEVNEKALDTLDENSLKEIVYNPVTPNTTVLKSVTTAPNTESNIAVAGNPTGSKSQTINSGSYTVKMTVKMNYEIYIKNNVNHYKITSATYTPTILDSKFTLTGINSTIGYSGSGYIYNSSTGKYTATSYKAVSTSYSKTNPSSGSTYSKSTGFTFYVLVSDYSGGGVNSSLSYKRISDGATYKLTLPLLSL